MHILQKLMFFKKQFSGKAENTDSSFSTISANGKELQLIDFWKVPPTYRFLSACTFQVPVPVDFLLA